MLVIFYIFQGFNINGKRRYVRLISKPVTVQRLALMNAFALFRVQMFCIPYHAMSRHTILYQYQTIAYLYHTIPYHTIPYLTFPYYTLPDKTIAYRTVPYRKLFYILHDLHSMRLSKCDDEKGPKEFKKPFQKESCLCRAVRPTLRFRQSWQSHKFLLFFAT